MKRSLICTSLFVSTLLAGTAFAGDGEDKFRKMDSNGDGRITATEHANAAQQMFMMADANKDGAVTMQEMEMHKDMKHDKKHGDKDDMGGDRTRRDDDTNTDGMDDDGN